MTANYETVFVSERSRYELVDQDQRETVGYLEIQDRGEAAAIPYVFVDPALRGRDLGARLVRGSLDDLRRKGKKVIPICPFAVQFFRRNPDYADMLAPT
jgi:uncharacterized protein